MGDGLKLTEGRSRLHIMKKFFTVRVIRHWHREVVDASSLGSVRGRAGWALSNVVYWNLIIFKVPSNT